jgi:hypothetical protein
MTYQLHHVLHITSFQCEARKRLTPPLHLAFMLQACSASRRLPRPSTGESPSRQVSWHHRRQLP